MKESPSGDDFEMGNRESAILRHANVRKANSEAHLRKTNNASSAKPVTSL